MKPLDDMLPEEQDPKNGELITFLKHANLSPMLVDPAQRAQILSRARGRLLQADPENSVTMKMPVLTMGELTSLRSRPNTRVDKQHRGRRFLHLLNVLAAALVIAALIGTSFLIFGPWSPLQGDRSGTAPPIGPVGTPVEMYAGTINGFEMSLKITPGPYFLSEFLEADLSITNHTRTTHSLFSPGGLPCNWPLKIAIEGGGSPHVTDIWPNWAGLLTREALRSCNWPSFMLSSSVGIRLLAAQTRTFKQYVQLTSSGHVTLTAHVAFTKATNWVGLSDSHTISTEALLASLHLSVSARIPSDRNLSFKEKNMQAIVYVPPAARGHLLYETVYDCDQGAYGWDAKTDIRISLPTLTLQKPQWCSSLSGKILWVYVVSAPGYATVSGKLSS